MCSEALRKLNSCKLPHCPKVGLCVGEVEIRVHDYVHSAGGIAQTMFCPFITVTLAYTNQAGPHPTVFLHLKLGTDNTVVVISL